MATDENRLLIQMTQKLGLAGSEQIVSKSTELLRLLQIKSGGGVVNLGDYAKATICIDLAASLLGLPFDIETAHKLSGLKKSPYANSKRTLEKLLDINKVFGISEICIQLGLSQVQKEATVLLENYKRFVASGNAETDFAHPQYATMAVFQACKKQKIKPPKTKLVQLSHLKPIQWNLLEKNWEKCLSSCGDLNLDANSKASKVMEADEPTAEVVDKRANGLKHSSPEKIEPYGNWKKRMLEKAYRELKTLQGR